MLERSLMKTTILLLASDPVVRSVLKEILERDDIRSGLSATLGQAADRLKESTPDLLVTRTYAQSLAASKSRSAATI